MADKQLQKRLGSMKRYTAYNELLVESPAGEWVRWDDVVENERVKAPYYTGRELADALDRLSDAVKGTVKLELWSTGQWTILAPIGVMPMVIAHGNKNTSNPVIHIDHFLTGKKAST